MTVLSGSLVIAFGVFLTALAALSAVKPQLAERFLKSFASSTRAHYFEQVCGYLRLVLSRWGCFSSMVCLVSCLFATCEPVPLAAVWEWMS